MAHSAKKIVRRSPLRYLNPPPAQEQTYRLEGGHSVDLQRKVSQKQSNLALKIDPSAAPQAFSLMTKRLAVVGHF